MYSRSSLPDSRRSNDIDSRLLLIDSTTFELFSDVMGGAGCFSKDGKRKGGVKAHVMLNPIHGIPDIVYLTPAKENDRVFLSKVIAEKGSILVFDRGYFNSNGKNGLNRGYGG
ncbi:MAG: transposase [Bacteroidetes bacterium]|nr:transposase [Bacteroidota bacterium]